MSSLSAVPRPPLEAQEVQARLSVRLGAAVPQRPQGAPVVYVLAPSLIACWRGDNRAQPVHFPVLFNPWFPAMAAPLRTQHTQHCA